MNKPVLPISFDSVSLAKPVVKKPVLSNEPIEQSFAERLSQSQRDMAKDKFADRVKDSQSQKKPHPKKDLDTHVNRLEKNLRADTKIKSQSAKLESTESIKDVGDVKDSTEESSIDTAVPITPDPTMALKPVEETGLVSTSGLVPAETDIRSETELLAMDSVPLESEMETPLAETNDELIIKGVDAKTFTENYLKGIDNKPKQSDVVEVNESVAIPNDTTLSETVEVNNPVAEAVIDQLVSVPVAIVEPRLTVPTSIVASPVSEILADENGMDLPPKLFTNNVEEPDGVLEDFAELIGETSEDQSTKTEDKSTKTDLFKSLLAQSQTEKSSVVIEKPTAPLVAPLTSAQVATANRLFVPQTQLGMNTAHPNWGHAVGEKILWMANQQLSSADIRLDPPELGSLQVKVSVQQDQANITFISPHPQVRELLDQQVTRLREMFAEQGLNLGQVDIADKREQESRHSDEESKSKGRFVNEEPEEIQVTSVSSLYLVDQFV